MSDYPVPHYAAHIWVVGNQIKVGLPPIEGHQQSHTVSVPWTEKGLGIVLRLLRDRESQRLPQAVATPASPTQWDIDQWMKAAKAAKKKLDETTVDELVTLDLEEMSIEQIEAELLRRKAS